MAKRIVLRIDQPTYLVYQDEQIIGSYTSLADAIDSDPLTVPYCPVCHVNAEDCPTPHAHMEHWLWT